MTHVDHVALLQKGVPPQGGVWADLGSGTGAFTLALRDLIGSEGQIYSIDKDKDALESQRRRFNTSFPNSRIHYGVNNFTHPLDLPPLEGLVMANSLHFVKAKDRLLKLICKYVVSGGLLIIVEYESDEGNNWVPYPTSAFTLAKLLVNAGFNKPTILHRIPSDFMNEIYAMKASR